MAGNYERALGKSLDWKLILIFLILILIGWVNIYASIHSSEPASIFDFQFRCGKQAVWILTSIVLALVILFAINPKLWQGISVPAYLFVLILLVAVIFLGTDVKGSKSWFDFGVVNFQPAEVSKITTSLLLATVMSRPSFKLPRIKDLAVVAAIIGLPMLVIVAESETGSALVYTGFIFVLYREGLSGWTLVAIGMAILLFILTLTCSPLVSMLVLIGLISFFNALDSGRIFRWLFIFVPLIVLSAFLPSIFSSLAENPDIPGLVKQIKPVWLVLGVSVAAIPILMVKAWRNKDSFLTMSCLGLLAGVILIFSTDFIFNNVLQDHQRQRIEVLLGMKEDPSGVGYNVNQSMIAIGSGGFSGKGFLNGTQTTYGFVPEQTTDFIFCTVGEEWGFLGCALVIILYVTMIWRILRGAEKSREPFTRIYGYCVASCIFMHLFINIGMTIGLMPVIGIPLPFLSYGGSSLWTFTILLFIFIALDRQEKKYF